MRIAHADLVHVVQRIADVVDAGPTLTDALRHQARPAVQVELAHVRGMSRIGHKGERVQPPAAAQPDRDQARLVDAPRHLAIPQAQKTGSHVSPLDAKRHPPAGAAAA